MPSTDSSPPPRRRSVPAPTCVLACLLATVAACAHARPANVAGAAAPPVRLVSDEDYARARAEYDDLTPDAPGRPALRAALANYLVGEARRELAGDRPEEAWEEFERALSMWDVEELRAPTPDPRFAAAAEELERIYRRRGAHREVLALLAAEIALRPGDTAAAARFDQVLAWVRGDVDGSHSTCNDKSCEQVIDDLESAVAAFPSPLLVERLGGLYWQRQAGAGRLLQNADGNPGLAQLFAGRAIARTGIDLARLYLRVSRPDLAVSALQRLAGQPGDDANLREALARWVSPKARPMDAVALAAAFARDASGRFVGLRICRDAASRMPSAVEPQLCVGELAVMVNRTSLALHALERALQIQPERRETWETLARLHQLRLQQLVGDERMDQLEPALARVEAFHAAAAKRFPGEPLKVPLAAAYDAVGRGLYNGGRIDDAVRHLTRSITLQPSPSAYEQRAIIELKRERGPEAVAIFREALGFLAKRPLEPPERGFWEAKLLRGLGDAYEQLGSAAPAREARRKSLDAWEQLLSRRLEPDETAEMEVERGRILYLLGERDKARESFERALDAAPERGASYADLLAFLVPRGERAMALEVHHRALGRSISEYLKVYTSLWIVQLDRRTGEPEDPSARALLASTRGGKWYHLLAQWAAGRLSERELRARADTPGRRCEADFYLGLRRYSDGRPDEGRLLLRQAIDSQMMAFFEFDMASYFLHHPPAPPPSRARSLGEQAPSAGPI